MLRAAREDTRLSQVEVARRAGVTAQALSRWETGTRPVRADDADRVLAACGKDVRFTLVTRHADIDEALERLAALPVPERMWEVRELLGTSILQQLQDTGAAVFAGAWAAAALGLPPLTDIGGLLVGSNAAEQARVAAALRPSSPVRLGPRGPWAVVWDDDVFQRFPSAQWHAGLLGEFTTAVLEQPVPELRLQLRTDETPWRVVAPQQLVPDHIDQLTLHRWYARAAT